MKYLVKGLENFDDIFLETLKNSYHKSQENVNTNWKLTIQIIGMIWKTV